MSVRTNSMTVIKRIFTQEIFTEIVVAQHAVKDTRLVTSHNRQVQTSSMPRHHRYSQELLNDVPIKFLLGKAERMQGKFEGLFPPLLRLASTQFPHLCLVEDGL